MSTQFAVLAKTQDMAARFWDLVDKDGPLPDEPVSGRCWIWRGDTRDGEIPVFYVGRQARVPHRVAWQLVGDDPLPPGMWAPACGRQECVRPDHRGRGGSGWRSTLTQCKWGHPLDDKNTYTRPDGKRSCRKCNARRVREIQRARRAARRRDREKPGRNTA